MKVRTADRLKEIMERRDLKQIDIVRLCEPYSKEYGIRMGKSDISQYVSGKVEPGQDKLTILGLALNVSEAWLMGYDVPMARDSGLMPVEVQRVPLLGDIACGEPIVANQTYDVYVQAGGTVKCDFCLRAHGDSMIGARIHDGDIVFVHEQPTVENGEIAAVIIDDETTLKRFYAYSNKIVLQAENPKYEPIVYVGEETEHVRVLGKAVSFQSEIK
ncbi:MAG: S24 family peptidase [Lachnospira sp.]|nr:S24 family peptidase [Lachnospira sp.]